MKKELTFIFCQVCNRVVNGKGIQPLGFSGWHYCSEDCWNKRDKEMQRVFHPHFNERWDREFKSDNIEDLEDIYNKINLSKKKVVRETIANKEEVIETMKKEINNLEKRKIRMEEEMESNRIVTKVILSHPDKCQRCLTIDPRGNYFRFRPKDNSKENKVFLCHKCYPIVITYVEDLWEIYRDWETVKKFTLVQESPLDKVFQVKVQGGWHSSHD